MKRIKIDRSKCIGCLICVIVCVVSYESCDLRNCVIIDSKIKVVFIFCCYCDKLECVYICMIGVMFKNKEIGYVEYDKECCVSCYMCIMVCLYGVLKSDRIEYKEIMKCNMCIYCSGNNELNFMCVEKCLMGVIILVEV